MDLTVRTGGRAVLASGSIISSENDDVEIDFQGTTFAISFREKESEPISLNMRVDNAGKAIITCTNFSSPFGTTGTIALGRVDGKPIELILLVHAVGESKPTRVVNYTLAFAGGADV